MAESQSLLWHAVFDLDEEQARQLLNEGANLNCRFGKYDSTPLIDAASEDNRSVVALLLQLGADVNAHDKYGHTALMKAADRGHHR